jgi:flagellin
MPFYINTNIGSLQTQRHMGAVQLSLQSSFEKLSSGYRINKAADDAAGLGVSQKLNADVRSFAVAERNTTNAGSMVDAAEGGLGEMSSMITRMRELAVQSANGDITATERGFIDAEFQQHMSEITRVASTTKFNGQDLLAGAQANITFQVGINTTASDTIAVAFGGVSIANLGLTGANVAGADGTNATAAMDALDTALRTVSTRRADFGAAHNRLSVARSNAETMRTNLEAANSAIRDVDVAEETSKMARSQVLLQAGTAVLSQANQSPQQALQLLR